ncbi:MAG: TonB-dependent receptor [Bacteroidales bacterium]|nr:TonB-dependent receptor [Bacteroidales bacterium]
MKNPFLWLLLFWSMATFSQSKHTISGYVRESGTGELLLGVNIYIKGTQTGTVSNSYGFYSITLPEGKVSLTYSYVGFQPNIVAVNLKKDTLITVSLVPNNTLKEVEIIADRSERISDDVQMSVVKVPIKQVKEIPALLGERDVFKVLQLMPGVRSGSEGSSGLYVRGGGADQNLIILDDAPVYNAYHLFGFFSVFNGDALKSVELLKGGFPARYGGRLSSVLDINMKDGNKQEFGGEGSIGILSSRLLLEGPIVKNKSSFIISGRRTYIDLLTLPFQKFFNQGEIAGYYFYDLNAKLNYEVDDKNKFYLSSYFGKDRFYGKYEDTFAEDQFQLYWQNFTITGRWNHLFNNKLFSNTSVIVSKYLFNVGEEYKEKYGDDFSLDYFSGIRDIGLKTDFTYIPKNNHFVRFGVASTHHLFTPNAIVVKGSALQEDIESRAKEIKALESAVYVEDEIKMKRSKINVGLRFTHFYVNKKNYNSLEPRLMYAFMINENLSLKGSYTYMNQYIHLLSNTGISLPIDLWVPSTDVVSPKKSHQVAVGIAKDFNKPAFSISLEGYYKTMDNIVAYKPGSSFLELGVIDGNEEFDYEDVVTVGQGRSYGAELLFQKKFGSLTGWVGYTLSWTLFQFDELNFGKEYFARHDRRHDVSVVAIYELNEKVTLSSTWVYGTGDALTLQLAEFDAIVNSPNPNFGSDSWSVYDYGEMNGFRMAAYHRLDLGVQFHKKLKKGRKRVLEVSIYNVYNRANPYFYYAATEPKGSGYVTVLKQVSLFPIIPSVSYYLKF